MSGSIVAGGQDELRARVRELKKKPMNCAIGDVGKEAVIRLHPTRQPTALLTELRKDEAKVVKPACGLAFVPEEKLDEVRLDLRTKPASGVCKRVAKRLKGTGLRKVVLLVMGELVDSHSVEEDEEQAAEGREAAGAVDPEAVRSRLQAVGESIRQIPPLDRRGAEMRVLLGRAIEALRGGHVADGSNITGELEARLPAILSSIPARNGRKPEGWIGATKAVDPAPSNSVEFAAALRSAQGDLKAARAVGASSESGKTLNGLIGAIASASAVGDYGQAKAATQQARSVAVRVLSDERVRAAQQATHDRMAPLFAKVEKTYFTAASIESLSHAETPPSKEFEAFIVAQAMLRRGPSIGACDAITQAADDYLAHLATAEASQPREDGKDARAKKAELKTAAEGAKVAARHMKMALELKAMGAPPWDESTAMRAQELCAAFNFETTFGFGEESAGKKAQPLGSDGGVSASFWITGHQVGSGDKAEPAKQFLFKPAKGEQSIPGFPKGGSAPREAISKALADTVLATTGLDLRVPDTTVVSVAPGAIDIEAYNKAQQNPAKQLATDQSLVGSMQQFAASKGPLSETLGKDRGFLDRLPNEECHRFAILDILTLNCDRHPGNFMVANGDAPGLIPIDHGLTFPSNDGLENIFVQKMNNPLENVLLCAPGNLQPFSEETAQRLEMLDPDAMMAATRASVDCLDQVHPELGVPDLVPDDSLRNARRAALFLKRACRRLTPAMIQIVLGTERAVIFGGSDGDFEQALGGVIADYEGKMPAIQELIRRSFDSAAFQKRLKQNGWHGFMGKTAHLTAYRAWVYTNPQLVLDAFDGNKKAPAGYVMPPLPDDGT